MSTDTKKQRAKKTFTQLVNELDDTVQKQEKEFILREAKIEAMKAEREKDIAASDIRNAEKAIGILERFMVHLVKNKRAADVTRVQDEIDRIKMGDLDIAVLYKLIGAVEKEGDATNG